MSHLVAIIGSLRSASINRVGFAADQTLVPASVTLLEAPSLTFHSSMAMSRTLVTRTP